MVLIQILAATLLFAGSALIFRALLAIDQADGRGAPPRRGLATRLQHEGLIDRDDRSLPRAA